MHIFVPGDSGIICVVEEREALALIPYAVADGSTAFAATTIDALLAAME